MASVRKRGSRWSAILWNYETKKQQWIKLPESITGKREAQKAADKMQEDLDFGVRGLTRSQPKSAQRFAEVAGEVLAEKELSCRPVWYEACKKFTERFTAFCGDAPICTITEDQCRDYAYQRASDEDAGNSASYRRKEFVFLRSVFHRAESKAMNAVPLPSEPKGKVVWLTPEQFGKLVASAPANRAFRYMVLAYTGVRRSEAWAMRWRDVDFKAKVIMVQNANKGAHQPVRRVPLCDALADALKAERAARLAEKRKATGDEKANIDDAPLFPRHQNWLRDFWLDCERVGLNRYAIHDLRHTYCSWLAQSGVPLAQIRDLAGHESIRTTERYAHLCPDAHEQVVAALQQKYCSSIAKNEKNGEKEEAEAA